MNADETRLAIAARAAGEDLPGLDLVAFDRLFRDDPVLAAESAELAATVALLRGASVASDPKRVAAVEATVRTRRRATWRWAAAAAVLFVAVGAGLVRSWLPHDEATVAGRADSPFAEAFRTIGDLASASEDAPVPAAVAGGRGAGASSARAGLLVPFAAQTDFAVHAPPDASSFALVAARLRRAEPGLRPFPLVWLEFATKRGPLVVAETPESGAADDALRNLGLPDGWRATVRRSEGVVLVVAARDIGERDLATIAAELVPVLR